MKSPRLIIFFIPLFFAILLAYSFISSKNQFPDNKPTNAERIFNICLKHFNKDSCYLEEFKKLANYTNLEESNLVLSNLQELDPSTRNCHLIAHTLGSAELKKDPSNWQNLLPEIDAGTCNGGFLHGLIEEKQSLDPSFVLDTKTIPEICQKVKVLNGAEEATCIHIMGHLILLNTAGDLPKALDGCLELGIENQDRCLGGVFMEYELRDSLVAHGLSSPIKWSEQTISDQENTCRSLKDIPARACWRELSRVYVLVYPENLQKIYENCLKSPNKEGAEECYTHSMGFIAASPSTTMENLKPLCSPLSSEAVYFLGCIMYVNSYMLNNSLKFIDRATFICQNVPQIHKTSCFNILAQTLKKLTKGDELLKLCQNNIPPESRTYCIND